MIDQDFSRRIVLVIRNDLEPWQVANTIGHISAFIGNQLKETFGTGEYFVTKNGLKHPRNSQYPIIIKRAKNNEQLQNLMKKVRESDVLYHGFIREMIKHTNDEDLQADLNLKSDSDIEYLGIGIFGENETLDKLTKKFGLWQ